MGWSLAPSGFIYLLGNKIGVQRWTRLNILILRVSDYEMNLGFEKLFKHVSIVPAQDHPLLE